MNYYFSFDNTPSINIFYSTASNVFVEIGSTHTFDTSVWHNVVYASDFTTSGTSIWLDGVSQTVTLISGTLGTPETIKTFFNIGHGNAGDWFNGRLADIGLWTGVKLTATEAAALAKGARPYQIRTGSLKGYWPLDGLQTTEPDLSGLLNNGTLTGTALAFGPPYRPFTPRWPQMMQPTLWAGTAGFALSGGLKADCTDVPGGGGPTLWQASAYL